MTPDERLELKELVQAAVADELATTTVEVYDNAPTPRRIIANDAARKSLYLVAVAVVGILVGYGVLSQDDANRWLELVGSIFTSAALIVAVVNVPGGEAPPPYEDAERTDG